MKTNLLNLLYVVLAVSTLAGCGRDKADAMKDYKNLPLTNKTQVASESINKTDVFRISCLNCEGDGSVIKFSDNQEGTIKLQVDVLASDIGEPVLRMVPGTELPGSSLKPGNPSTEARIWYFKWKPANVLMNTINPKQYLLQVEARAKASKSPQRIDFLATQTVGINVYPVDAKPRIEADTVPSSVKQGESVPFTIDVFDPANKAQGVAPTLKILRFKQAPNAENPTHDGSYLIKPVSMTGPNSYGAYQYSFVMDTKDVRLPGENDPHAEAANMCFSTAVTSPATHNTADDKGYCVRVRFAVQIPRIKWADVNMTVGTLEVVAGKSNTISFDISAPDDIGNVLATVNASPSKNWPSEKGGDPQYTCTPLAKEQAPRRTCTLTWTPSCKFADTKDPRKVLSARLTNTFGGTLRNNSSDDHITLLVSKKDDSCNQAPAVAAATPPAVKAAKTPASTKRAKAVVPAASSASANDVAAADSAASAAPKKKVVKKAQKPKAPASAASSAQAQNDKKGDTL